MILVGTAGWTIPREHAARVPPGPSALARYAQLFDAVEINSSFWRSHRPSTYARWAAAVPAGFRFAVKLPREISHARKLAAARSVLEPFFAEVRELGDKLGPVLLQLAPSLQFEPRRARSFFALLRELHQGEAACEPRHPSWLLPGADQLLASFQIARVAADPARAPGGERPGGFLPLAYHRLHGSPRTYYSAYGGARWPAIAAALTSAGARRSYCFFDNTASGAALGDALGLAALVRGQVLR